MPKFKIPLPGNPFHKVDPYDYGDDDSEIDIDAMAANLESSSVSKKHEKHGLLKKSKVKHADDNTSDDLTDIEQLAIAQQKFKRQYKFRSIKHSINTELIFLVMIVAIYLVSAFFIKIYTIRGDGMAPSLIEGRHVIVNTLAYKKREPRRGDLISAGNRIYRVIGLPGEEVTLYSGRIYINDTITEETYLDPSIKTYIPDGFGTVSVPKDAYFVLCDNRNCYDDSRTMGMISKSDIEGRIVDTF
jgi:signal peptidase I